ncbi:MAG TPA: ATP-binding cassette domain-containing protein, partial [Phytomonospora sp.]
MTSHTAITFTGLVHVWPDGSPLFDGLSGSFGIGRTGLIGLNGSGKSTLLRLIAGELEPARGTIAASGEIGYLPQDLVLRTGLRVDEALDIAGTRAALRAIADGDAREEHFTAVGDDWDVEERAVGVLDRLGLGHLDLDRTVGEVSGGESV